MLKYFKRHRPAHQPETAPEKGDILTAYCWGLTLTQWNSLTDFERAECRRNITTAPRFES